MKHYKKIFIATLLIAATSSAHAIETVIDFEDQDIIPLLNSIPSLTVGDVTFSTTRTSISPTTGLTVPETLAISSSSNTFETDFSGNYLTNNSFGGFTELKIDFSAPVSTFSFNFGDNQNDWELTAFDTTGTTLDSIMINALPISGSNNGDFFGLSSDSGISFALLTNKGVANLFGAVDNVEFDNLKYTEVSPVPEPSTYALMLGGLGMVGFIAYRRRKTANA